MLSIWVNNETLEKSYTRGTVGQKLIWYTDNVGINPTDIVLIGGDEFYYTFIDSLAQFAWGFENQRIVALGVVRKTDSTFLRPFFDELKAAGATIVFVGAQNLSKLWFDSYDQGETFFSPVIVDEKVDTSPAGAYGFVNNHLYKCFQLNFIGTQVHLNHTPVSNDHYHIENLRLGKLRSNKELIEPAMRDSHFLVFNINALKKSDAPAKSGVNPSGLNAEEADQICRYAGLSEALTLLNICGYTEKEHKTGQTSELIAQMIWYFLDGYSQRKQDYPLSENDLTGYVVDLTEPSTSLHFVKSKKSGRWWLKIPVDLNGITVDRMLPCTYHDYQMACEHELSERIIQALERNV